MRIHATFLPAPSRPHAGRLALYTLAADGAADAQAAAERLHLGNGERATALLARPGPEGLSVGRHQVWAIPLSDALGGLYALRLGAVSDALAVWGMAARLAVMSVQAHHLVPSLVADGPRVHGVWRAVVDADPDLTDAFARLAGAMPCAAHALALDADRIAAPDALLQAFMDAVADLLARRPDDAPQRSGRPRARLLPWTARWAEALTDPRDPSVPLREDAADIVAAVAGWRLRSPLAGGLLEFLLHAPDAIGDPWRIDFGVRSADGSRITGQAVWAAAARGDTDHSELLLTGLARAARVFAPVEGAMAVPRPEGMDLTLEQAWELITHAAPVLSGAGIILRLPGELTRERVRARVRIDACEEALAGATPAQAWARTDGGGASYTVELAIGAERLEAEEQRSLLRSGQPLVRWRDRWVLLDDEGRQAAALAGRTGALDLGEALTLGLQGSVGPGWRDGLPQPLEVVTAGPVRAAVDGIRHLAERLPDVPAVPEGFAGRLRPYQRRGVAWLRGMAGLGLGAVLADEMGLGKTVELIAFLLSCEPAGPFLVVCPTSVVGNWEREFHRFAPQLPVVRHHGPDRASSLEHVRGVVVTSYGTLRQDRDVLLAPRWDVVTLDEAQKVKNPQTATARAVRALAARIVVALTGTPLENRLSELWALLDATNPGLLGTQAAFSRRFVQPVEQMRDAAAAERLRRLVAPFVLRRAKSDPGVAADLPPKIERTISCVLTPEQASRYRAAVQRALDELAGAEGIGRRGRILALLTELKQITNHPAQHGREGPERLVGRSGKFEAAREIVAEATAAGDRVLVFTQFVAMGRLLVAQLQRDLGTDVPFLHGAVTAAARDRMVASFQVDPDASPVLVVSTRAGGLGLNLSAATHVVHYDRWWNPAVEDQATDRAHRIGQRRTVEVHKLVTGGTIEERIAEVLEHKRALATAVVGGGEAWITELDDDAVAELVALRADSAIVELEDEQDTALVEAPG